MEQLKRLGIVIGAYTGLFITHVLIFCLVWMGSAKIISLFLASEAGAGFLSFLLALFYFVFILIVVTQTVSGYNKEVKRYIKDGGFNLDE